MILVVFIEGLFLYAIFTVTAGFLSENAVEPPTLVITHGIFEIVQGGEISIWLNCSFQLLLLSSQLAAAFYCRSEAQIYQRRSEKVQAGQADCYFFDIEQFWTLDYL